MQIFFITSDLQFGFKAKRSTNMCTMVLKEAIDYYTSNGSCVLYSAWCDKGIWSSWLLQAFSLTDE